MSRRSRRNTALERKISDVIATLHRQHGIDLEREEDYEYVFNPENPVMLHVTLWAEDYPEGARAPAQQLADDLAQIFLHPLLAPHPDGQSYIIRTLFGLGGSANVTLDEVCRLLTDTELWAEAMLVNAKLWFRVNDAKVRFPPEDWSFSQELSLYGDFLRHLEPFTLVHEGRVVTQAEIVGWLDAYGRTAQ